MAKNDTSETERIAREYFDAWTSRNTAAAAAVLAEGFTFIAGDMSVEGRHSFLDAGAYPDNATTEMVAEAYQGEDGFQMYVARSGDRSAHIVEHLVVRNGAIQSSTFVTDMTAFMSLMAP